MALNKKRKGLTLIELTIVLGVMSIVMGAIWHTASVVNRRYQIEEAVQTFAEIATRTRNLYGAIPQTEDYADTTSEQIDVDLFPGNVVRNSTTTRSPWEGDVTIAFLRYNDWLVGFSVAMELSSSLPEDVRNEACVGILRSMGATGTDNNDLYEENDTPLPDDYPIPQEDLSPDGGAIYAYAGGGSWSNVSNLNLSDLISEFGSNGCDRVGFFFKL